MRHDALSPSVTNASRERRPAARSQVHPPSGEHDSKLAGDGRIRWHRVISQRAKEGFLVNVKFLLPYDSGF